VGTTLSLEHGLFPHMSCRPSEVCGIPARVGRVSYTGEVTFEIAVPARRALDLWRRLEAAGGGALSPVGTRAWNLLRTEKGYFHVGGDTDGTTSPLDVGWKRLLERDVDFVGRRSLLRINDLREDRHQLVGLRPVGNSQLPIGSQLGRQGKPSEGYVTSSVFSPTLDRIVALGMVRSGHARLGERLDILHPVGLGQVEITVPDSLDPEGIRLDG
jgi:sarcosine oxidase subunit alpha